jgi:hypothetical protein
MLSSTLREGADRAIDTREPPGLRGGVQRTDPDALERGKKDAVL